MVIDKVIRRDRGGEPFDDWTITNVLGRVMGIEVVDVCCIVSDVEVMNLRNFFAAR